jgi:hypothetical protein
MNVDSSLWKVNYVAPHLLAITQKASNTTRYVSNGVLPPIDTLASIHENRFNALCREAFHNAAKR